MLLRVSLLTHYSISSRMPDFPKVGAIEDALLTITTNAHPIALPRTIGLCAILSCLGVLVLSG